jgi:hypothetical protein
MQAKFFMIFLTTTADRRANVATIDGRKGAKNA